MNAWIWLLAAVVAGAAAYYIGWRAWDSYRHRDVLDANTDRYLAWRGRAAAPSNRPPEGMTGEERRKIYIGIGLGIVAVACFFVFLSYPPG